MIFSHIELYNKYEVLQRCRYPAKVVLYVTDVVAKTKPCLQFQYIKTLYLKGAICILPMVENIFQIGLRNMSLAITYNSIILSLSNKVPMGSDIRISTFSSNSTSLIFPLINVIC
jgi:hypothetical protein